MFLSREKNIIKILLESNQPIRTADLAIKLDVSKKTISNSIQQLKPVLQQYNAKIMTKPSVGTWIERANHDENDRAYRNLEHLIYQSDEDFDENAKQHRRLTIAKSLLEKNQFQSIESIAESNFYSNSTVYRELDELYPFFEKYGLQLIRKPNAGVKLEGSEKNIRIAEAEVIKMASKKSENYEAMNDLEKYFSKELIQKLQTAIEEMEKKNALCLPYLSRKGLIIHLGITLNRVHQQQDITLDHNDLEHLAKQREWVFANDLIKELEKQLDVCLNEKECGYITIHLMGASLFSENIVSSEQMKEIGELDPKFYQEVLEIVDEISVKFTIPFNEDKLFINSFFLHLKPMLNRLKHGITLYNPFIEDIKRKHYLIFEISTEISKYLKKKYDLSFNENEIAYIAMHVGSAIERISKRSKKSKVILVCASGIGTSQFLKARLMNHFPEFEVVKVLSSVSLDLNHLDREYDYDYLLTTVPLHSENEKVIFISPLLIQEDIDHLKEIRRTKKNKRTFISLLDAKISMFAADIEDYEDAIEQLGKKMCEEGYVDEGYIHSAKERESISSTAVGNLIAIPHAYQGHIIKQGIGMLIAKKPFFWKEAKVQLVFLLGIDSRSSEQFTDIFTEIAELVDTIYVLEKVLKAKNFKECIEILVRM